MTGPSAPGAEPASSSEAGRAALLVLAAGLAVVLVRPPLPVDETRYLEVFRESLEGGPLLLRLLGEPYAEKPPLLFWLGRVLGLLGLPALFALRCVPALASAWTVWQVGRLGRRAGVAHAAWMQAALWLPSVAGQFLFFDPLLAACVWSAVEAWTRRRDAAAWAWSSGALLAKGPVAFLFLVPLFWALGPLGTPRAGDRRRAGLALGLALVPLAAWAIAAAVQGGPEFASALLWERWAGRVVKSADHARPLWFYLPVALAGSLPALPLLFPRRSDPAAWVRRLERVLLLLLVVFTLISGKQAHYLVPAAPALALVLAARCARAELLPRLLLGVRVQLVLLLAAGLAGAFVLGTRFEATGPAGAALLAAGAHRAWLAATAGIAGIALFLVRRAGSAGTWLRVAAASLWLGLVPVHFVAGRLLYPHELAHALADGPHPIAYLGSAHHGLYALLAGRLDLEKLTRTDEVEPWARAHPQGLVVVTPDDLEAPLPSTLRVVTSDVVHRARIEVLRWSE